MRAVHVVVFLVLALPTVSALLPAACGGVPLGGAACATPAWTALDDGGAEDDGRAIALSPEGARAYTVGFRTGPGGFWDRDALVVAHGVSDGAVAWRALVPSATGPNEFWTVAADDARVYAAGTFHESAGTNPFHLDLGVAAFDASDGALLWTSTLDLTRWDQANAVLVADGMLFVAGNAGSGQATSRALVLALDAATGATLWTRELGTFSTNDARDLAYEDGTLFVGGTTYSSADPTLDMVAWALDGATGDERWLARYDGPAGAYDTGSAIAVRDGLVALVGTSEGTLDDWGDIAVVAYDAQTGAERWAARHAGLGLHYDGASDVAIAGGAVFVSGITHVLPDSPAQPLTLAYDAADGAQRWLALEGGLVGGTPGEGLSLVASDDGSRVYVAGRHRPVGGSTDALVLAYDGANGAALWRGVHSSPPGIYDTAEQLVLTPDGARVLVAGLAGAGEVSALSGAPAGGSGEEPHGDVLTVAFDA